MNLQLNCKAVTDEILALSALRCATSAKSHRLITRDQLPGLRIIMRMVFAELMVELTGLVDTCNIDTEDPDPTLPYDDTTPLTLEVGLKNSDSFSPGMALTVKRQLEHMVAAGTLGWAATESDADFSRSLQNRREAALSALRNTLEENATEIACRPSCDW